MMAMSFPVLALALIGLIVVGVIAILKDRK